MLSVTQAWDLCAGLLALAAMFRGVENALRFSGQVLRVRIGWLSVALGLWALVGLFMGARWATPWWMLCGLGTIESMRAQGLEQGGSDPMTLWLRAFVAMVATWGPGVESLLSTLAASVILGSYVCAGLGKARRRCWYNGRALAVYIQGAAYEPSVRLGARVPRWCFVLGGLGVLAFELAAPTVLFDVRVLWVWSILGVLFHALNILCFGLHRFFWVWISAYPFLFSLVQV